MRVGVGISESFDAVEALLAHPVIAVVDMKFVVRRICSNRPGPDPFSAPA